MPNSPLSSQRSVASPEVNTLAPPPTQRSTAPDLTAPDLTAPEPSANGSPSLSPIVEPKAHYGDPDLVFLQDIHGRYVSFSWVGAQQCDLPIDQLIGLQISEHCGPLDFNTYQVHVETLLETQVPQQWVATFCWGGYRLEFDLTLTLATLPGRSSPLILATGYSRGVGQPSVVASAFPGRRFGSRSTFALEPYQKLLTQISWNIRRTLHLETIWQQTVDGLGQALRVDHCIVCPIDLSAETVCVVAEYRRPHRSHLLGEQLPLANLSYFQQALSDLSPVITQVEPIDGPPYMVLAVATCYQDQPNGLIALYHDLASPVRSGESWNEADIDLVWELADQVGTAIAHAGLFAEAQELAVQLQQVNDDLRHKHQELEEARTSAEEASRLKSEFLANTSHELRTPLNGMIGFLRLVLDDMADSPEEQKEFTEEAHHSALLLLDIINDILDVAKIEAGKLDFDLSPVRFNELLQDVERKTRTQAQQKELTYQIDQPSTHDEVVVFGDYQRLLQVMLNLVGNAIKFTPEGRITISTKVMKQRVVFQGKELPGFVKVRVADTGIGVSLDAQAKLFKSFSQVDGSRTRQYGGTGLGLVISQKLIEGMGGTVHFYSMGEGLGSTVTFTVPLYQEPVLRGDEE
jgi:signal transduction histidine kinase